MRIILVFLSLCAALNLWGQGNTVWMHPNVGQWDAQIHYIAELSDGFLMVDNKGFTFDLMPFPHSHSHEGELHEHEHDYTRQVIKNHFPMASWKGNSTRENPSGFYRNYLSGTDSTKWHSKVYSVSKVTLIDFFQDVDMQLSGEEGAGLKYSFVLQPYADVSQIYQEIEGSNAVFLDEAGNLHYTSYFGEVIESKPIAWEQTEHGKKEVKIAFRLNDNKVSYYFPNGYDASNILVIDPSITFSTFTGSTANNWGTTATPDAATNLFGGGTVFNTGGTYPVTPGAYSGTHAGGTVDIGITKFTADGADLIYSTYLGGGGSDAPNSMICNEAGQLYIFGVTSSNNFPMAGTPYDNTWAGGPPLSVMEANSLGFTEGTDIFVAKLSADGTSLLASTYMGGSSTDGVNTGGLRFNYGDQFRGEITLDALGNVYVASTTQSSNFPVVLGAQGSLSGSQDAVLFKLSPNLNALLWSTYYGGSGLETGNSVQVASNGSVYMVGGTNSSNLNLVSGEDLSFNGGVSDGYLTRFNGNTGAVMNGTYIGQNEADQMYFVQLDLDDNVYVFGQTQSSWAITPGKYGIPNSGQIIRKYTTNLSSVLWTTMIGSGIGQIEISPTAFLVSDCYDIYFSGWGGSLNASGGSNYTGQSTTTGFPVTVDAYQSTTNGNNFYIGILGSDATLLKYATFMGGTTGPANHVDGGTSRFDKGGRIYHAVCASCGTNLFNGFPTTPGAWSNTAPSTGYACNMACFKFDLNVIEAIISEPAPLICIPDPVIFNNNSANGNAFYWDFGDGNSSTDENPVHYYDGPGEYIVTLIVVDTNNCFASDSVTFSVNIGEFQGGVVQPTAPICPGDSFQFEAYGGTEYLWSPEEFLDDPTSATPIAVVDETTDFAVIITDSCGIDTVYVTLPVFINGLEITEDTSICIGNSVVLSASGGISYTWSPPDGLSSTSDPSPVATPIVTTLYHVTVETSNGCILEDSVLVEVYYDPPAPVIPDEILLCLGTSTDITVSGAQYYYWSPDYYISSTQGSTVTVNPPDDVLYYCDFVNACGLIRDSVQVTIVHASIEAGTDTIVCPGESAILWASGGVAYTWSPVESLNNPYVSSVVATPAGPTTYTVYGLDLNGCVDTAYVFVDVYPQSYVSAGADVYAFYGDEVQLMATANDVGDFSWSPVEYLSCVNCPNPIAQPDQDFTYTVSFLDKNGCTISDQVTILYDAILYVPNTFTPNGIGANNVFGAKGGNIDTFHMLIFNRWGEVVGELKNIHETWDGTYNGQPCQDGTYTWKIVYSDRRGKEYKLNGHVNVIR